MTTATETDGPGSIPEGQAALRSRLARLRRRLGLQMGLESLLDAAAALAAAAAVLVFLDWWLRLGLPARRLLLASSLAALALWFATRAFRRWRASRLDDLSLAATLDRFRPGTGGRVADVLQLPGLLDDPSASASASPALVRRAVRLATEALDASDWSALWNRKRTLTRSLALAAAVLAPLAFAAAAPAAARLSLARWLRGSSERWPQRTYLSVTGLGDRDRLVAPRDEPLALEVRSDLPGLARKGGRWWLPGRGEPLGLRARPSATAPPGEVRVRERGADGVVRDSLMAATAPGVFRHELPPSTTATTVELAGGDDRLGPLTVERVDRPSLEATKLRVREPGSPGNDFREVEDARQHPVFLPDTEVELTLVGSEPIADARLTVHPGQPPQLARVDGRSFSARWTLREAATLEVRLTSKATGLASKPAFLSIGLLRDREPRVAVRALGVGAHVTSVATIPLSLTATDDRGLAAVRLRAERTTAAEGDSEPKTTRAAIPLPLADGGGKAVLDHQARHDVELRAAPPAVGTVLRFVGEAEDRCARGAQVGRSPALQMQVVAPDELFYEILVRQRVERAKYLAALEAAEKLGATLEGSTAPDAYAAAARGLQAGTRQTDQIAGRIADTLQEMTLNQVGSPKSHRLLREGVIEPIRALNAGPAAELRDALRALAGSSAKAGASPEAARRLHADVVGRMKVILEQMSQWESFVDVVNQVAEVIKMQQNVLQAAEKARDSRTQEVFDDKP